MQNHHDRELDLFPYLGRPGEVAFSPAASDIPIPFIDLAASGPLEVPELPAALPPSSLQASHGAHPSGAAGQLWLCGDVLMCACPDCGAPMSVRIWLMLADCWQCGTTIELSEEQERHARQLLKHPRAREATNSPQLAQPPALTFNSLHPAPRPNGKAARHQQTPTAPSPERTTRVQQPAVNSLPAAAEQSETLAPTQEPKDSGPSVSRRLRTDPPQHVAREQRSPPRLQAAHRRPTAMQHRLRARLERESQVRGVTAWISDLFGSTPAWLVSLVFHLILLTLLSLFTLEAWEEDGPYITLSTSVRREVLEGGDVLLVDPEQELVFDLPVPKNLDLTDERQREAVVRADQDARELRLDPDVIEPNLPDLARVKNAIGTVGGPVLAARDPRIRVEVVKREGGTTLTEAAVARGLRWLAHHQHRDGRWSLDHFNRSSGCTCDGTGTHSDAAGTSLALLPFLGAGQTHLVGSYQETVARGLRWLLESQRADGDLRAGSSGNTGMYAHGQAAIVLCEAYLMTGDESLRGPAQKALDFIVSAQHSAGGWRYSPGQAGDTSVVGWQVMALQSGRAAKLDVPPETMELAGIFLDSVSHDNGAKYSYLPQQGPTHVMTAEALLCRMYLGWKLDVPGLQRGVQYLVREHLPSRDDPDIYYWYYGTQALHHHGGPEWQRWNARMREILVETQERRGHEAGSWAPRGPHASAGGRLYMTALATCSLEVYYRHLPIFRQIDLD